MMRRATQRSFRTTEVQIAPSSNRGPLAPPTRATPYLGSRRVGRLISARATRFGALRVGEVLHRTQIAVQENLSFDGVPSAVTPLLIGAATLLLLLRIFRRSETTDGTEAEVDTSGKVRKAKEAQESVGEVSSKSKMKENKGKGPFTWANEALFGGLSSLSWWLIVITLLASSSFSKNLLEDLLMY